MLTDRQLNLNLRHGAPNIKNKSTVDGRLRRCCAQPM